MRVEWTPELAVETDTKVRTELRTSRASLIRFVAEGAWRLLPAKYSTAAAYVQDAAGVKRSEAYRLVATARAAQMLLTRYVQNGDEGLDIKPYRWIVNEVIRSSHTGEYLCSIIHDLTLDIENRLTQGADVYTAISDAVAANQKPGKDGGDLDGDVDDAEPSPTEDHAAKVDAVIDAFESATFPDASQIERGQRVIVCPNCHTPLR